MLNWPFPHEEYAENEYILNACYRVWRVVHLYHKPKTVKVGKRTKTNWTPEDVDLFAFLSENARRGWTLHEKGEGDGESA